MRQISETAYLVAMYRALETERSQALFRDPLARRLAGGRGEMLVALLGDQQQGITSIALRTAAIDEMLLRLLKSESIDIVLNLAAGFDTRPYRLALPAELLWIEIDLPEILIEKAQKLAGERSQCQLNRIELDLTDIDHRNAVFREINAAGKTVLILSEGLLPYLTELQVSELSKELASHPSFQWWLFELAASSVLHSVDRDPGQQRFDQYFACGEPTFLFAPVSGTDFFQPDGWQVREFRSLWHQICRSYPNRCSNRLMKCWMQRFAKQRWNAISQSGFTLLERAKSRSVTEQ